MPAAGELETITAYFTAAGVPVTGLSPTLTIRCIGGTNDDKYLQTGLTWGAAKDDISMVEVDDTNSPGEYEYEFTLVAGQHDEVSYIVAFDGTGSAAPRYGWTEIVADDPTAVSTLAKQDIADALIDITPATAISAGSQTSIVGQLSSKTTGLNYNRATDSLEALADAGSAGAGGGSSFGSGSEFSTLAGSGYLSRMVSKVREMIDDPGVSAKYSNSMILTSLRDSWAQVIRELNQSSDAKLRVRMDLTITADTNHFAIPPIIGQWLEIVKVDDRGKIEWEIMPRDHLYPTGPNFQIQGPTMYVDPQWRAGETMRITYVPTGEAWMHEGVADSSSSSSNNTLIWASTTAGTVDSRPNAYAGYILRWIEPTLATPTSSPITEERLVTAYEPTTGTFTYAPALTNEPDYQTAVAYEVVPMHWYLCEELVSLRTALRLARVNADKTRESGLLLEYQTVLRAIRQDLNQLNIRGGKTMKRKIRR